MAKKDEKKTVVGNEANSGPEGEGGTTRMAEELVGKGSLADQLAEERKRREKRLKEITGK